MLNAWGVCQGIMWSWNYIKAPQQGEKDWEGTESSTEARAFSGYWGHASLPPSESFEICYFQRSPTAICNLRVSRITTYTVSAKPCTLNNVYNLQHQLHNNKTDCLSSKCFTCLDLSMTRVRHWFVLWKLSEQLLAPLVVHNKQIGDLHFTMSIPSANALWSCRSMKWLSAAQVIWQTKLRRVQISFSRNLRAFPSD